MCHLQHFQIYISVWWRGFTVFASAEVRSNPASMLPSSVQWACVRADCFNPMLIFDPCRPRCRWEATARGWTSAGKSPWRPTSPSPCRWTGSLASWPPPLFTSPWGTKPTWYRRPKGGPLSHRSMSEWQTNISSYYNMSNHRCGHIHTNTHTHI